MAALWSVPQCKDIYAPPRESTLHLSQFSSEQREKTAQRKIKRQFTVTDSWTFTGELFFVSSAAAVFCCFFFFLSALIFCSLFPPQPRKWRMEWHIILILGFTISFWVTTRMGSHALVLKKHISFLTLLSSPVSVRHPRYPVSSDWSAHTCLTQQH